MKGIFCIKGLVHLFFKPQEQIKPETGFVCLRDASHPHWTLREGAESLTRPKATVTAPQLQQQQASAL